MKKNAFNNNVLKTVQLRGGFSDRNGIKKLNTQIQLTDFDERTRVCIQNGLNEIISTLKKCVITMTHSQKSAWISFYIDIAANVYCEEVINSPDDYNDEDAEKIYKIVTEYMRSTIYNDSYDSVLTLLEYSLNWTSKNFTNRIPAINIYYNEPYEFEEKLLINKIFEKEFVGYRFVGDFIVPIIDNVEVKEIEKSLDIKIKSSKLHIEKALRFLSDRENPDYKNSIKESISAVEAICKIIVGDEKSELNKALKKLKEKGLKIHPALEQAWNKLYAYTCDEGGVRHSEKAFESNVTFEEAKYMLVSCCAFVNYLIGSMEKLNEK